MAATLLLIKPFAMLPHPELADAEEAEELKRDLVERLLEYQRYRGAAEKLRERALHGVGRIQFAALFEDANDRSLVIATFMALLELSRRREVRAFQEVRFGP